jgi:hypothetical protein
MYRCENSPGGAGVHHDRIWRTESVDGIHDWTDDRIVIEGEIGAQDDLSCSPGVVVAPNGVWHLYYLTAQRTSMCDVELWHATSFDGIAWTKLGKVAAVPRSDCSLLQPSPVIEGDKIGLYFVASYWGTKVRLWRVESDALDGHAFTSPSLAGSVAESRNGRVTRLDDGRYVFAYANVASGEDTQPDEIHLATGLEAGPVILRKTPGTFYATFATVGNYVAGPPARLYVSGNYLPRCHGPVRPCYDFFNSLGVIVWR